MPSNPFWMTRPREVVWWIRTCRNYTHVGICGKVLTKKNKGTPPNSSTLSTLRCGTPGPIFVPCPLWKRRPSHKVPGAAIAAMWSGAWPPLRVRPQNERKISRASPLLGGTWGCWSQLAGDGVTGGQRVSRGRAGWGNGAFRKRGDGGAGAPSAPGSRASARRSPVLTPSWPYRYKKRKNGVRHHLSFVNRWAS